MLVFSMLIGASLTVCHCDPRDGFADLEWVQKQLLQHLLSRVLKPTGATNQAALLKLVEECDSRLFHVPRGYSRQTLECVKRGDRSRVTDCLERYYCDAFKDPNGELALAYWRYFPDRDNIDFLYAYLDRFPDQPSAYSAFGHLLAAIDRTVPKDDNRPRLIEAIKSYNQFVAHFEADTRLAKDYILAKLFVLYHRLNTVQGWNEFVRLYPDPTWSARATLFLHVTALQELKGKGASLTGDDCLNYIKTYPDSALRQTVHHLMVRCVADRERRDHAEILTRKDTMRANIRVQALIDEGDGFERRYDLQQVDKVFQNGPRVIVDPLSRGELQKCLVSFYGAFCSYEVASKVYAGIASNGIDGAGARRKDLCRTRFFLEFARLTQANHEELLKQTHTNTTRLARCITTELAKQTQRLEAGLAGMQERVDKLHEGMMEGLARLDKDINTGFAQLDRDMVDGFKILDKGLENLDRDMNKGFETLDKSVNNLDKDLNEGFAIMHKDQEAIVASVSQVGNKVENLTQVTAEGLTRQVDATERLGVLMRQDRNADNGSRGVKEIGSGDPQSPIGPVPVPGSEERGRVYQTGTERKEIVVVIKNTDSVEGRWIIRDTNDGDRIVCNRWLRPGDQHSIRIKGDTEGEVSYRNANRPDWTTGTVTNHQVFQLFIPQE